MTQEHKDQGSQFDAIALLMARNPDLRPMMTTLLQPDSDEKRAVITGITRAVADLNNQETYVRELLSTIGELMVESIEPVDSMTSAESLPAYLAKNEGFVGMMKQLILALTDLVGIIADWTIDQPDDSYTPHTD